MSKNYSVFLRISTGRNYQKSVEHVMGRANCIWKGEDYAVEGGSSVKEDIAMLKSGLGSSSSIMDNIGTYYLAKASSDLLVNSNVREFKQDVYVSAKLKILGIKKELDWTPACFWGAVMSDNINLISYFIKYKDKFNGTYKRTDLYFFFFRNALLALAGDWDILRERTLLFLNETKKPKQYERWVPDHEFYLALCNQDKIGMENALNKLLEPRMAKKAAYDCNVWFDFYLQIQVVLYGKIASIHGFDLDIDSPIAPKELIKYDPLPHYEDPYDFMKEFDYNRPQQEWIDMWQERMRIDTEKAKKKKGFFSWFKR